ncbi:hypothetical protein N9H39_07830 [Gammaproteobacteria bacterium]|nr:hypothetical protein [Gammaproteobacteria bacterium]
MPKLRPLYPLELHERLGKLGAITLALLIAFGALLSKPVIAQDARTIVFVNVNVVPMDSENILRDHVVVTRGDRIVAVGTNNSVTVPNGAE